MAVFPVSNSLPHIIDNLVFVTETQTEHVYIYDDDLYLVYDYIDDVVYYVKRCSTASIYIYKEWHRVDGPAYIGYQNGVPISVAWYLDDIQYSLKDWLNAVDLSDGEKLKLRMKYSGISNETVII